VLEEYDEDFENSNVLDKWHGKYSSQPDTATLVTGPECYGGTGSCMKFNGCIGSGDAISLASFTCTQANPCHVHFRYKGPVVQGFTASSVYVDSQGKPRWWTYATASSSWPAARRDYNENHVELNPTTTNWTLVEYTFPKPGMTIHAHRNGRSNGDPLGEMKFMVEASSVYDTHNGRVSRFGKMLPCTEGYVDDIVVKGKFRESFEGIVCCRALPGTSLGMPRDGAGLLPVRCGRGVLACG